MLESRMKSRAGLLLLALGITTYLIGIWHYGAPWSGSRAASRDTLWALLLALGLVALLSRLTGRFDPRRGFALALAAIWLAAGGVMEILGPIAVVVAGAVVATLLPAAGLPVPSEVLNRDVSRPYEASEGVETASELEALQALGVDDVQGYHLARPLEVAALAQRLRDERLRN